MLNSVLVCSRTQIFLSVYRDSTRRYIWPYIGPRNWVHVNIKSCSWNRSFQEDSTRIWAKKHQKMSDRNWSYGTLYHWEKHRSLGMIEVFSLCNLSFRSYIQVAEVFVRRARTRLLHQTRLDNPFFWPKTLVILTTNFGVSHKPRFGPCSRIFDTV